MQGHTDQAEAVIMEALGHARTAWGEQSSDYANVLAGLASECLLAQGCYAEAESLLPSGSDDLRKRLGPQNRLTLQANRRLHDLYAAWNKPAEAARCSSAATVQKSPVP